MQMNKVANGRHAVRAESQDSVTIPGDAGAGAWTHLLLSALFSR